MSEGYFYHYTPADKFRQLVEGSAYSGKTGLIPLRRVIFSGLSKAFNLPQKSEEGAVFGLLEPQPVSWMTHDYHKGQGLLETIIQDMSMWGGGLHLLKCRVLPTDDIHVADHVFHMNEQYNGHKDVDNPVTGEVKRAYWNSMVPFFEYRGQHTVAEVISFSPIPLERIQVVKTYESSWHLINELRAGVGRALLPPRPKPNYDAIWELLGVKP